MMKGFPLISVIVPVYNVEVYIEKCLNSLLCQTYQNIEIILVNDGSTDKSDQICKQFADRDERIKLIYQLNQGLSAARNTGIYNAKGDYLMFVDSDDWVAENILEVLYVDISLNNLKLSMVDFQKVLINSDINHLATVENSQAVIKKEEAIQRMLLGEWWSACMKLYQKSIFENIRFPVGRNNEDYAIMIHVFEQCDYVSFNTSKLYYYLTRPNSITTSKLNERSFDEIDNCLAVFKYVKEKYPQFSVEAEFNLGASLLKLMSKIYLDTSNRFLNKISDYKILLNEHYKSLLKSSIMPFKQKIFLFTVLYCNRTVNVFLFKMYNFYNRFRQNE